MLKRFEKKYLIDYNNAKVFIKDISNYFFLNKDKSITKYYNNSIYFDTPEFQFYTEKGEGLSKRVKGRLRFYHNTLFSNPKDIYCEFKTKDDSIVKKYRSNISKECALKILNCSQDVLEDSFDEVVNNFIFLKKKLNLHPAVRIIYGRSEFNSDIFQGLRLTLDSNLKCSTDFKTLHINNGQIFLDPQYNLIEIKYNNAMPVFLTYLIKKYEMTQITYSKFYSALGYLYKNIN